MRLNSVPRVRVFFILLLVSLFSMGCLAWPAILAVSPSTLGRMPNLQADTPTPAVLPTVPPGGTPVTVKGTYFHSSGVLSLPQIDGWDPSPNNPEEKLDPYGQYKISRAGIIFTNPNLFSVIHAFVEHDPIYTPRTIKDLNAYFDKANLDASWAQYTGGWKELNRHTDKDVVVINLQLIYESNKYMARMLARLDQGWLVELRLVAPQNNPKLLEDLNTAIWPNVKFWVQGTTTPMAWLSVADPTAGYVIKFPPNWQIISGKAGEPILVRGEAGGNYLFLTTSGAAGQSVTSKDQAVAWVKATHPDATKITAKAGSKSNRYEFLATYSDVDPDNTPSSGLVGFVNGRNNMLYAVDTTYGVKGLSLTNQLDTNVPIILSQVRASFFLIAPGADPKARATTTPTPAPTASKR